MNKTTGFVVVALAFVVLFIIAIVYEPCAKWDFNIEVTALKASGSWEPMPALFCLQGSSGASEDEIKEVKDIKNNYQDLKERTEIITAQKEKLENDAKILESLAENDPTLVPVLVTKSMGVEEIENELAKITLELSTIEVQYMESLDGLNIVASSENERNEAFSQIEILTGPIVELDQKVYTWTDKVYITITDPWSNTDPNKIETIGTDDSKIMITTESGKEIEYTLEETGYDTSFFTGEIILTGFPDYDVNNDSLTNDASGRFSGFGPVEGMIPTNYTDTISVIYKFSSEETVVSSAKISWSIGETQFLEPFYQLNDTAVLRVIDPDLNIDPEAFDFVIIKIISDTSPEGIEIVLKETNQGTGIFEGAIKFTTEKPGKNILRASLGDRITAIYLDKSLPDPYSKGDELETTGWTQIKETLLPG